MKNITLAVSLLLALVTAACTDDESPAPAPGKLGRATETRIDDGRVMWVDVIGSGESALEELHHYDSETGIDEVEVIDEKGFVISTRLEATEIPVDGTR